MRPVSVKIGDNLLTFRNNFGGNVFYPSSSFWTVPPPWRYLLRQPLRDPDNGLRLVHRLKVRPFFGPRVAMV